MTETYLGCVSNIAIVMCLLGLFFYAMALFLAAFASARKGSLGFRLKEWLMSSPAQHIGIPCSAVAAFAIVAALLKAFPTPPQTAEKTALALNAFGMEFTGPSGPITLWLLCFLGFVIALKLLRR